MRALARGLLLGAALTSVLVASAAPPAAAQSPAPFQGAYKSFVLNVNTTYVRLPFLTTAYIAVEIEDISRDSTRQPGVEASPAGMDPLQIQVNWTLVRGRPNGWGIGLSLPGTISSYGGQTFDGTLSIAAGGAIKDPIIGVKITAAATLRDGTTIVEDETVIAQVEPFYRMLARVTEYPPGIVDQWQTLSVPIAVDNVGLYMDAYRLNATMPEGWLVTIPPMVYVPPGESRIVNLTVTTPKGPIYEFGNPRVIMVNAQSIGNPAVTYQTPVGFFVQGWYFGTHLFVVGSLILLCVGLLVTRSAENRRLRVLEKGRPRPLALTPRQRVLLLALKQRDPDAYQARAQQLRDVYRSRRQAYRARRRDEARAERREMKAARADLKADRARRKDEDARARAAMRDLQRREAVVRRELRRKQAALEKDRRKLDAQRRKVLVKEEKRRAKEAKRLGKVLAKKRKALGKERAKAATRAAKAEKVAAKAAKKASSKRAKG